MIYGYVLWLAVSVAGVPAPVSRSNTSRRVTLSPPNIPPIVKQCFYEGRWFPAGSIIKAGRSGDWCFGSYCDLDGKVKHWDDYTCPPPDKNNPHPPFPDLNKIKQQTTTTAPHTHAPITIPATPTQKALPPLWFQTTTMQPFDFNFNEMGCYYRGQYFWAGDDIENKRRGRRCMGVYCDWNGVIQKWNDDCGYTVPPPTLLPPTRPPLGRGLLRQTLLET